MMVKKWYGGIFAIGLAAVLLGVYTLLGIRFVSPALNPARFACLVLIVSGIGVIARQKWAYFVLLVFCAAMMYGAFSYLLDRKEISSRLSYILLISYFLCTAIYFILPPVRREFKL